MLAPIANWTHHGLPKGCPKCCPPQAAALEPFSNLLKPLVGIAFSVAIEGSRIAIVGAVVKNQMEGKEFGVDKYGKKV